MQRFFQSGAAFLVVALICMIAGVVSDNAGVFVSIGAFWLIMALIMMGKNAKKPSDNKSEKT
ncbi:MAG: hypothetical protein HYW57_03785 [Ignavibacteriales bacterium]|nr:hypothetical protein [Ignavibacteriales bacterium]